MKILGKKSNVVSTYSKNNQIYRGYKIVFNLYGDGYDIYDKYNELEDCGYPSIKSAKQFIDELIAEEGKEYCK